MAVTGDDRGTNFITEVVQNLAKDTHCGTFISQIPQAAGPIGNLNEWKTKNTKNLAAPDINGSEVKVLIKTELIERL